MLTCTRDQGKQNQTRVEFVHELNEENREIAFFFCVMLSFKLFLSGFHFSVVAGDEMKQLLIKIVMLPEL